MAKKQVIEIARQFLALLRNEGFEVDKLYLYGSYSRETETPESDIDILVVSNSDTTDDYIIGKIWAMTKRINSRIEPYLVSKKQFENDDTSPIIQIVKKEGIEIAS
ncbi:MAG: nucleotidyltransferase domain-containing protein [Bacteroidales bacterium]